MIHVGDIVSPVVRYYLSLLEYLHSIMISPHGTEITKGDIPQGTEKPSTVLMISPMVLNTPKVLIHIIQGDYLLV